MDWGDLLIEGDVKSASFTGRVGIINRVNVTTAQIDVTFPSATTGQFFGYYVGTQSTTAGSFAQAPGYMVEPNNPTIESAAYTKLSTGCAKWGIFLSGEVMIWRYVDGTIGWIPYHDGRKALITTAYNPNSQSIATGAIRLVEIASTYVDIGNRLDTTNRRVNVKRSGSYALTVRGWVPGPDDGELASLEAYKNGSASGVRYAFSRVYSPGTDLVAMPFDRSPPRALAGGDYVDMYASCTDTFSSATTDGLALAMSVEELL